MEKRQKEQGWITGEDGIVLRHRSPQDQLDHLNGGKHRAVKERAKLAKLLKSST